MSLLPPPFPRPRTLSYIACEGCGQTWSWTADERLQSTFNEWYAMLDDLLLGHLIDFPTCWALMTKRTMVRPSLPTQTQPHHER